MPQLKGIAAALLLAATGVVSAASGAVIRGAVYDDPTALALPENFSPIAGASVKLYRDGAQIASARTSADGAYTFDVVQSGDYTVVVDSKSLRANAWPEQTYGPAGAQCVRADGSTVRNNFPSPCIGGRRADVSDDASTLDGAEHVAIVTIEGKDVIGVDFAFSANVVSTTRDGANIQGSLRQFVDNANALRGANVMRFAPIARTTESAPTTVGVPARWWKIDLQSPLAELRDAETTIDGTARNYIEPASQLDPNPGFLGRSEAPQGAAMAVASLQRPELELIAHGEDGIACTAACIIRALAMHGAATSLVMNADARVEHVIIGARPDLSIVEPATVGLQIENGRTTARYVYVSSQRTAGIAAVSKGTLEADRVSTVRCGTPAAGSGIALLNDGSVVRASAIRSNEGAGIVIGTPESGAPARNNSITGCTISGNVAGVVLAPGASANTIENNVVTWNRIGGIVALPAAEKTIARANRITANDYNENGGRPIVLHAAEDVNALAAGAGTCERVDNVSNRGVAPPMITSVDIAKDEGNERFVVKGRACPGTTVELYRSFVTTEVREASEREMRLIRAKEKNERETVQMQEREYFGAPSIGEFNFAGKTMAEADGTFELAIPFRRPVEPNEDDVPEDLKGFEVWHRQVLVGDDPTESAFSALAIDGEGNTSELSVRKAAH